MQVKTTENHVMATQGLILFWWGNANSMDQDMKINQLQVILKASCKRNGFDDQIFNTLKRN